MTLRGTCPACFRDMPVVQGREHGFAQPSMQISMGRHGWQEEGGRQVGVYNKAWHAGACFGVGWLPFEISVEGTEAYLTDRLFPAALSRETTLAYYATCPALFEKTTIRGGYDRETRKYDEYPYETCLELGAREVKSSYDYATGVTIPRTPSYDQAMENRTILIRGELSAIRHEGADCYKRIAAWTLGELRDEERVPTVHFQASGARLPYCGSRSRGIYKTGDEAKTTCTRCKKSLDSQAAYAAAQKAKADDGLALVEWLRTIGKPVTVAEIKKGLGWDAKRFNAAYDKADRYDRNSPTHIERSWTKPTKYSIPSLVKP